MIRDHSTRSTYLSILENEKSLGRQEMKTEVLAIVRQCLVADPSLQKLVKAIEGLK